MKKIIGVITIIVIILVTIIVKRNDIYKVYKTSVILKDTINCLNGEFSNNINDYTIREYEVLHIPNEELNHYNVTELIDTYMSSVLNGMSIYIKNNKTVIKDGGEYIEINEANDLEFGRDVWMKYYTVDYAVGESFINEDIRNYSNGRLKDLLINNLKECLDYEEQDGKIEWYINSTEDKIIELPYNCYIDYKAYHREDNKEFKRAIDVIFNKDFELKHNLKKVVVKYETIDGNILEKEVYLYYTKIDGKDYYDIDILNILTFGADTYAECTLSSYALDRWREEMEAKFFRENPIVD